MESATSSSSSSHISKGKGKAISRVPPANLDTMPMEILQEIGLQLPMPAHAHCFAASCRTVWASLGSSNQFFWFLWFRKVEPKKTSRFNPFVEIPVNTRKPVVRPSVANVIAAPPLPQGPAAGAAGAPAPQGQAQAQAPGQAPAAAASPPQAQDQATAQQDAAFNAIVHYQLQLPQLPPLQPLQIIPQQPPPAIAPAPHVPQAAQIAPQQPPPPLPQGPQIVPQQMHSVGIVQAAAPGGPTVAGGPAVAGAQAPGAQVPQPLPPHQQTLLNEQLTLQRAQQHAIQMQVGAFQQAQMQSFGVQVQDDTSANQAQDDQAQAPGNIAQPASAAQDTANMPPNPQQNDTGQTDDAPPAVPPGAPQAPASQIAPGAVTLNGIQSNHGAAIAEQYSPENLPPEFQVKYPLSHQKLEQDPFKRFSPTFDYYNYAVLTLGGSQIEHRCQGCLTPSVTLYRDGEHGNMRVHFQGVEFTSWTDENGKEHVHYHHEERVGTRRYYCKGCALWLLEPNVQDIYLGVDVSRLSYVSCGELPQLFGKSVSSKWYLKSDLRKAVESATGCSIADLKAVAAAEEEMRIINNDDTFLRIANAMLDKLENDPSFRHGLFDREEWLEELMCDWDKVAKWCLWGLSDHQKNVKINEYVRHIYGRLYIHYDAQPERFREIFISNIKEDNLFGRFFLKEPETVRVTDAETELAAESLQAIWEAECVKSILLVWPGNPLVERHDRRQGHEVFINKAIWRYASIRKFTADMAGIAGLCPHCKCQTYYTPYG